MGKRNLDWWERTVITTYRFMGWGNNVIMWRKMKWCLWALDEQHRVFVLRESGMWKVEGRIFYAMLIVLYVHKSQSTRTLCIMPLRGIFSTAGDRIRCTVEAAKSFFRYFPDSCCNPILFPSNMIYVGLYCSINHCPGIQVPKLSLLLQFLRLTITYIIWVEYPNIGDIKKIIQSNLNEQG